MISTSHCLIKNVTEELLAVTGSALSNRFAGAHGEDDQLGSATGGDGSGGGALPGRGRRDKGRILDELCATTGWHRKHAVRVLRAKAQTAFEPRPRGRRYGAAIKDAIVALWEASDRVCGKRLKPMIPLLLPALIRHVRLTPTSQERAGLLAMSAATIDRLLVDVKIAAAGGRRRRVGFFSAIRREVPIRTFNDWGNPLPGFCEIDMVAHGGTSVAGSFIQTLTLTDIATGWTE